MFLEDETLKLRALEPEDIELLYNWENDTEIWSVSSTLTPFSKYILKQYIENSHHDLVESKQLRLIIEKKGINRNTSIGTIDLFDIDFYNQRAGIGILIANEEYRKKGFATAAIEIVHKYCKSHLGLKQLYCHIDDFNINSIKLFQKTGYELNGKQKLWKKNSKGWNDVLFLQFFFD